MNATQYLRGMLFKPLIYYVRIQQIFWYKFIQGIYFVIHLFDATKEQGKRTIHCLLINLVSATLI